MAMGPLVMAGRQPTVRSLSYETRQIATFICSATSSVLTKTSTMTLPKRHSYTHSFIHSFIVTNTKQAQNPPDR